MTRRETLVAVLRGTNGYSLSQLNAMNALGVNEFLVDAENRGISHKALANELVAFKNNGGSGLANAIAKITSGWNTPAVSNCEAQVQDALAALKQAQEALQAVIG